MKNTETAADRETAIFRSGAPPEPKTPELAPDFWTDATKIAERRRAALALEDDIGARYISRTKDNIKPLSWPVNESEQRAQCRSDARFDALQVTQTSK